MKSSLRGKTHYRSDNRHLEKKEEKQQHQVVGEVREVDGKFCLSRKPSFGV